MSPQEIQTLLSFTELTPCLQGRQGACPALICKYSVGSLEVLGYKRIRIPPFKEINSPMADPKQTSAGFKQN